MRFVGGIVCETSAVDSGGLGLRWPVKVLFDSRVFGARTFSTVAEGLTISEATDDGVILFLLQACVGPNHPIIRGGDEGGCS